MNIIITKTTLLPTPFVGTTIKVRATDTARTFGIYMAVLANNLVPATVDWGDGTRNVLATSTFSTAHEYAENGDYTIRISDDIKEAKFIGTDSPDAASYAYAELPIAFATNATKLVSLNGFALAHCHNLTELDLDDARIATLVQGPFKNCTGLRGEIRLPSVSRFTHSDITFPFAGCTGGITKIHFAAANEEAIKATTAYRTDPTLGTGTAEVVFDL